SSPATRAAQLLADTDDAARELSRWLVRASWMERAIPWHILLRALRAPEFDGLAKPARRWARVAHALRGLGFERDLDHRLRAEPAPFAYAPRAHVLPLDAPGDVRVLQSALDFGLAADVYAAQAVGEGLALTLVSPALATLLRWPLGPSVASALGTAFMQLRADASFLRRFEGLEGPWLERAARHAALVVLFEARAQAACVVVEDAPARGEQERARQLAAALERALGVQLPPGLAALWAYAAAPGGATFDAFQTGLAVHVGLRERLDADWYRNPRVADVLRGAAARGNTLDLAELRKELNVSASAGSQRLLELLE
ncbi:MAG TPA: hypothetical protein VJR89_42435, partial [Polyangiales bacterium]|nr:hypothetical protein [Polyangiales bacterium]